MGRKGEGLRVEEGRSVKGGEKWNGYGWEKGEGLRCGNRKGYG